MHTGSLHREQSASSRNTVIVKAQFRTQKQTDTAFLANDSINITVFRHLGRRLDKTRSVVVKKASSPIIVRRTSIIEVKLLAFEMELRRAFAFLEDRNIVIFVFVFTLVAWRLTTATDRICSFDDYSRKTGVCGPSLSQLLSSICRSRGYNKRSTGDWEILTNNSVFSKASTTYSLFEFN